MPSLNIDRATYDRLARKAAARNTTVDLLVEPVLEQLARDECSEQPRREALDEWMSFSAARASRYPRSLTVDDSRESVYEGGGE